MSANRNPSPTPNYRLYEQLKANLTAKATTPAEFEAACRKAAKLAGV